MARKYTVERKHSSERIRHFQLWVREKGRWWREGGLQVWQKLYRRRSGKSAPAHAFRRSRFLPFVWPRRSHCCFMNRELSRCSLRSAAFSFFTFENRYSSLWLRFPSKLGPPESSEPGKKFSRFRVYRETLSQNKMRNKKKRTRKLIAWKGGQRGRG